MKELIYIHGFNSSPQSLKARETAAWALAQHPELRLQLPALPHDPALALARLQACIATCQSAPALIGSSMGGFYATILAEQYGLRAVLINPAVHPHRLLRQYLGENENYHTGERYTLTEAHVAILAAQEPAHLERPENLWVLLQSGDETLDYRQAQQYYAACPIDLQEGGSHSYEAYADRLPEIYAFLSQDHEQ